MFQSLRLGAINKDSRWFTFNMVWNIFFNYLWKPEYPTKSFVENVLPVIQTLFLFTVFFDHFWPIKLLYVPDKSLSFSFRYLATQKKTKERASPEMFFTEKYVRGIPQQKLRYQHAFILFLQDFKGNISKSCFKGLVGLQVNLTDIRKATDLKRKFQLESNTNQISEVT